MSETAGQQHPIGIYLKIWLLLFVFSAFSYAVDYFHLQGYLRWSLILIFMFLKAGFIVAIFSIFEGTAETNAATPKRSTAATTAATATATATATTKSKSIGEATKHQGTIITTTDT